MDRQKISPAEHPVPYLALWDWQFKFLILQNNSRISESWTRTGLWNHIKRCNLPTFLRMLLLCQQAGLSSFLHLHISSLFSEVTALTTWTWCWTLIPGSFLTNTIWELLPQTLLYDFSLKKFLKKTKFLIYVICDAYKITDHENIFFFYHERSWHESHHNITVQSSPAQEPHKPTGNPGNSACEGTRYLQWLQWQTQGISLIKHLSQHLLSETISLFDISVNRLWHFNAILHIYVNTYCLPLSLCQNSN